MKNLKPHAFGALLSAGNGKQFGVINTQWVLYAWVDGRHYHRHIDAPIPATYKLVPKFKSPVLQ